MTQRTMKSRHRSIRQVVDRVSQRTDPDLSLLGAINLLGDCWLCRVNILLLQALQYVTVIHHCAAAIMGHGSGYGQIPTAPDLEHIRLYLEPQSGTVEREGAWVDYHSCLWLTENRLWTWTVVSDGTVLRYVCLPSSGSEWASMLI